MKTIPAILSLLLVAGFATAGYAQGGVCAPPCVPYNPCPPKAIPPCGTATKAIPACNACYPTPQQVAATHPAPCCAVGAGPVTQQMQQTPTMCGCAMTTDGTYVYVMQGNQLLKFASSDLSFVTSTAYPPPPSPAPATSGSGPSAAPSSSGSSDQMNQMNQMSQPNSQNAPSMAMPWAGQQSGSGPQVQSGTQSQSGAMNMANAPSSPACTMKTDLSTRPEVQQKIAAMQQMQPAAFERGYLQMIVQAHAAGISWSQLATTKAVHADLRRFAQRMADHESSTNMTFINWLQKWYSTTPQQFLSPSQTDSAVTNNLQNLSGQEFEVAYIQAMVNHLSEAIALSQMAQTMATHPEAKKAAMTMANGHTTDLQQIRKMASGWYNICP